VLTITSGDEFVSATDKTQVLPVGRKGFRQAVSVHIGILKACGIL